MSGLRRHPKPVKLRGLRDATKRGVAAADLRELLEKGCALFRIPLKGSRVCTYDDGTEVTDEYFETLPGNTTLVLLSGDEAWSGFVCDIARLLGADAHSHRLIEAAKDLMCGERSPRRRKVLGDLLLHLEDSSEAEEREEDEGWFHGVDARFKTKSAYMKYSCENRIRNYMKEVVSFGKSIAKATVRAEFMKTTTGLAALLKSNKYHGCYFDRTDEGTERLCTREGWFTCQGAFDQDVCGSLHSINPYSSRESRILFSTWNLDHRIEKKRTVIPALLEAVRDHRSDGVNLKYFYQLLFTRENLKLVHIVCHDKAPHRLTCDGRKFSKASAPRNKCSVSIGRKRLRVK